MRIFAKLKKLFFLSGGFYTAGKIYALIIYIVGVHVIFIGEDILYGIYHFIIGLLVFIISCKEFHSKSARIFGCRVSNVVKWSICAIMQVIILSLFTLIWTAYWGTLYVSISLLITYVLCIFKSTEFGPKHPILKANKFLDILWKHILYVLLYVTSCIGFLLLFLSNPEFSSYSFSESLVMIYGGAAIAIILIKILKNLDRRVLSS